VLYLARKTGESVIIDNHIEVTVISVSKNIVKLGFTFPSSASVLRKEVHNKIAKENVSASNGEQDIQIDQFSYKNNKDKNI
jgi:carbon storage regulator